MCVCGIMQHFSVFVQLLNTEQLFKNRQWNTKLCGSSCLNLILKIIITFIKRKEELVDLKELT